MVLSDLSDQLPGMELTSTVWTSQVEYSDERLGVNLQVSCSTMVQSVLSYQLPMMALTLTLWRNQVEHSDDSFGRNLA